jgi:Leucine-rich repeat (LRR) protein
MLRKMLFFIFVFRLIYPGTEVVPGRYGLESDSGIYNEIADISRILPIMSFMKADSLVRNAISFVRHPDFLIYFDSFPETEFKNELRRQYYLYKKELLDKTPISFSVYELFNAGILDQIIDTANNNGILNLSGYKISSLDGLQDLLNNVSKPLKSLDLSNNYISLIRRIDFAFYIQATEDLNLSNNNIYNIEHGSFDGFINLLFLDLGQNNISVLPEFIFFKNKNLKKIDLSDNSLRFIDSDTFNGLQLSLKQLNLADNPLKTFNKNLFKDFKNIKNIYW